MFLRETLHKHRCTFLVFFAKIQIILESVARPQTCPKYMVEIQFTVDEFYADLHNLRFAYNQRYLSNWVLCWVLNKIHAIVKARSWRITECSRTSCSRHRMYYNLVSDVECCRLQIGFFSKKRTVFVWHLYLKMVSTIKRCPLHPL